MAPRPLLRSGLLTSFAVLLALGPRSVSAEPPAAVAPAAVAVAAPVGSLDAVLSPLTDDRLFRDAKVGIQVVDLESGQEVYSYNGDDSLAPASTMKVLTAATALRTLGPAYRFTTTLLTDGTLGDDGVLEGNLYVRGTGDPTMVVEKLWKMVYDLRMEGVTEIKGDIVFDDDFMTSGDMVPGWDKKEDLEEGPSYYASLGALTLNFNSAAVVVGPGATVGQAARVELETPAPGIVEVKNELVTGSKGSRRRITMDREIDGKVMTLTLKGSVPQGTTAQRYYRTVPDATAHFTAAFAGMMKSQGIKVRGKYIDGRAPDRGTTLVEVRSPPLAAILADTNKYSNNLMAEQVLRAVGAEVHGAPGTTEKGLQVVSDYLTELGIPADEYQLVNGSGLSREMRLRPSHLTAVLVDMAQDTHVGAEFNASLAIGGRDGTLWARFRDEEQVDRLRGKTGTLNGVHCLTGYVEAADGRRYAFAFLVNDVPYSISRARRVHDRFADIMFGLDREALAQSGP